MCHCHCVKPMHVWQSLLVSHADGEEKPSKRSTKESTQGAVAILKHRRVPGCVSRISDPKRSILRKAGEVKRERFGGTHRKILRTHLVRIRETKRAISRFLSKRVTLMSEILARLNWRTGHLMRPHNKKIASAKQRGIGRNIYTSSKPMIKLRSILLWT